VPIIVNLLGREKATSEEENKQFLVVMDNVNAYKVLAKLLKTLQLSFSIVKQRKIFVSLCLPHQASCQGLSQSIDFISP